MRTIVEINSLALNISSLLKIYGVQIPTIEYDSSKMSTTSQMGLLCIGKNTNTIYIKANLSDADIAFTIAHEIRHLWQFHQDEFRGNFDKHHINGADIKSYNEQLLEIDANAFAYAFMNIYFGLDPLFKGLDNNIVDSIKIRAKYILENEFQI